LNLALQNFRGATYLDSRKLALRDQSVKSRGADAKLMLSIDPRKQTVLIREPLEHGKLLHAIDCSILHAIFRVVNGLLNS